MKKQIQVQPNSKQKILIAPGTWIELPTGLNQLEINKRIENYKLRVNQHYTYNPKA